MFSENGSIQQILRNVSNIEKISFDIGNRVVKVAYLSSCSSTRTTLTGEQNDESPSSRIHCIQVSCANFPQLLSYIAENSDIDSAATVYTSTAKNDNIANEIACKLKPSLQRVEVAECIFIGTNFLLKNIEAETYTYNHQGSSKYDFTTVHPEMIFPYMVVNVGTGVSIIRVDSETEFNRIGGSSIGGGTFVGIGTLLTEEGGHCHVYVSSAFCDVADVEKLIKMAEEGDHRAFDLLVSDIYGSRFDSLGLPEDLIASSFAKHAAKKPLDWSQKCNAMRSLLFMIMNNIGQLAWLYANREDIKKIYFNGFLVRNHPVVMRAITYALDFWSAGTLKAHFLRHESYTSVIGAILKSASREKASQWWRESYIGCTSMGRFVPTDPLSEGFAARTLELECAAFSAYPFPLLADASYVPDEVNLIADKEAMTFWLNIMQSSVSKVSEMARSSQVKSETVEERAAEFEKSFIKKVDIIREKPFAYGHANVRNLLELREQVLNEHKFDDPYLTQKHAENYAALKDLRGVLGKIDNAKGREKWLLLCRGVLAGNVFDWGAAKVVEMMQREGGLSFDSALDEIPDRPWLYDGFESFLSKKDTYKSAAFFVDNSGADFILGVMPFIRELASQGTKVIVVSNLFPALNDITYPEMIELIPKLAEEDTTLGKHFADRNITFTHHGQGSPCLDFRRIHSELNKLVLTEKVDLVVIEGMGRALHTNFSAKFKCDSIKVAVIKTKWLADRMGGKLFSVVFKHDLAENND